MALVSFAFPSDLIVMGSTWRGKSALASDLRPDSLSRFFNHRIHTEHTEINPPTVMSCFRVFVVFRGSLLVTEDDFAKAAGVAKVMVST